jgi:hypothetical protein
MKMEPIAVVVIAFITYIGGLFTMYGVEKGLPPKTNIQNISQNVSNKNTSIQESSQEQITVVTGQTNFHISINAKTNISKFFESKKISKTNTQPDKPLIPKLKLP